MGFDQSYNESGHAEALPVNAALIFWLIRHWDMAALLTNWQPHTNPETKL